MAEKTTSEKLLWTPEQEVALFHAMQGRKPVGINKHFNMICIQNRFSQAVGFTVSAKQIWDYLLKLYDIDALDEVESIPFSTDLKEFSLPDGIKEFSTKDQGPPGALSHRKRGRRSSTGSASPVSSPSNSKVTSKRKR
jgi:MRG-binding protein